MFEIEIKGTKETQDKIKNSFDVERIKEALIRGGLVIEGEAKIRAPVDTGRLRNSISTNWDDSNMTRIPVQMPAKANDGVSQPRKTGDEIAVVRVGTNVEYAIYQEFGTRRMLPHSFLIPATMNKIGIVAKMVDDAIQNGVESNE